MARLTNAQRKHLSAIRAKIAALPKGEYEVVAPLVVKALRGLDAGLFQIIDNEIGNAVRMQDYNGNGWVVRSVRNDPVLGPQLYATFR